MAVLAQIVAWLNAVANALGRSLLAPDRPCCPAGCPRTIVAAVLGLADAGRLQVHLATSGRSAGVRDDIKAHLLALKLFPDSPR